jgi:hypothetical protein
MTLTQTCFLFYIESGKTNRKVCKKDGEASLAREQADRQITVDDTHIEMLLEQLRVAKLATIVKHANTVANTQPVRTFDAPNAPTHTNTNTATT